MQLLISENFPLAFQIPKSQFSELSLPLRIPRVISLQNSVIGDLLNTSNGSRGRFDENLRVSLEIFCSL